MNCWFVFLLKDSEGRSDQEGQGHAEGDNKFWGTRDLFPTRPLSWGDAGLSSENVDPGEDVRKLRRNRKPSEQVRTRSDAGQRFIHHGRKHQQVKLNDFNDINFHTDV